MAKVNCVNALPLTPIYGVPAKNVSEVLLRVHDLNRILARSVFEEILAAHRNKMVDDADLEKARQRRVGTCLQYIMEFVHRSVIAHLAINHRALKLTRLSAQIEVAVALEKLAVAVNDPLIAYIANNIEFSILLNESSIQVEWHDIQAGSPPCPRI